MLEQCRWKPEIAIAIRAHVLKNAIISVGVMRCLITLVRKLVNFFKIHLAGARSRFQVDQDGRKGFKGAVAANTRALFVARGVGAKVLWSNVSSHIPSVFT